MFSLLMAMTVALAAAPAETKVPIASNGTAQCVIVTQPGATAAERHAAEELADTLRAITGATFEIQELSENVPESAILLGPGPAASRYFADVQLDHLGGEEYIYRTQGSRLLVAGGRPRGTLYGVYRLLQDELGVRWYTPWFTHTPKHASLMLTGLDRQGRPAFEYRDPYWTPAFDGDWAARNGSNSQSARLEAKHGGQVTYQGFVHTFYPLVPPAEHFQTHPEWFSLVGGKRVAEGAQLCTSNPQLRDFIVERVKAWLRESPGVKLISVSQNDHAGVCECPQCTAIDEREGTHAGSLLELVNHVAERIEPEFPNVLVDTLAYQYTRKAPKTLRPRHNVVIRLCSIECNFARPLDDASNERFVQDIRDWQRLTNRLYVWDYTTDFWHYLLPFPNWYVLGPNVRFFRDHGVVGLFEQGSYQSFSTEMSELRAWVLAQLLWNPDQDDRALVREFLEAYYGPASARPILDYFALVSRRAQRYYVGITHPEASPFLRYDTLSQAERLWQLAEDSADTPDRRWRVRQARLSIGYLWLAQWTGLQRACRELGQKWPIDPSRKAYAAQWLATINEPGPAGWQPMSRMREAEEIPTKFAAQLDSDPDPAFYESPPRLADAAQIAPPQDLSPDEQRRGISLQDDRAMIFREPECTRPCADEGASDKVALAMTLGADKARGAMEMYAGDFPDGFKFGRYAVYFVARVEAADGAAPDTPAMQLRVCDDPTSTCMAERTVKLGETAPGYRAYPVGTVELGPYSRLRCGRTPADNVHAVWLDRVFLVPAN